MSGAAELGDLAADGGFLASPRHLVPDLRDTLARAERIIDSRLSTLKDQVVKELRMEDARLAKLLMQAPDLACCGAGVPPTVQRSPRSKWSEKFSELVPVDIALDIETQDNSATTVGFESQRGMHVKIEPEHAHILCRATSAELGDMEENFKRVPSRERRRRATGSVGDMRTKLGPVSEAAPSETEYAFDAGLSSVDRAHTARRSNQQNLRTDALYRFVTSIHYEGMVSACILINCATMGLEAQQRASEDLPKGWVLMTNIAEHVFTAFFFLEFLLNWRVFGLQHFTLRTEDGRGNFADAVLAIGTGVGLAWVVPAITFLSGVQGSNGAWRSLSVLRALRLARLVRVFRKVPLLREAWMLIRGLTDSARTLLWTVVVIFFVTYTFAIFGIVLIVENLKWARDDYLEEADQIRLALLLGMMQGVDRMMYTLVQVLAGDSFHSFMRDILIYLPWSWIYFYGYIAIASLVLMNLVTAIIVENALETSRCDKEQMYADKEAGRAKEIKELEHMFAEMDVDGSGTLNLDEFQASFLDDALRKKWILLDFRQEDCKNLFDMLDDGDGEVSLEEFFDGLMRMRGGAQAKEIFTLQKMMHKLSRRLPPEWSSGGMARLSTRSMASKGHLATSKSRAMSANAH